MTIIIILLVSIVTFMLGVVYASYSGENAKRSVLEGASLAVIMSTVAGVLSLILN